MSPLLGPSQLHTLSLSYQLSALLLCSSSSWSLSASLSFFPQFFRLLGKFIFWSPPPQRLFLFLSFSFSFSSGRVPGKIMKHGVCLYGVCKFQICRFQVIFLWDNLSWESTCTKGSATPRPSMSPSFESRLLSSSPLSFLCFAMSCDFSFYTSLTNSACTGLWDYKEGRYPLQWGHGIMRYFWRGANDSGHVHMPFAGGAAYGKGVDNCHQHWSGKTRGLACLMIQIATD